MASTVYETEICGGERSHHCAIPAPLKQLPEHNSIIEATEKFPGVGAFDHLEWTYDGAFEQLFSLESGEFDQKFSKNSNARGIARAGGGGGMFKLLLS